MPYFIIYQECLLLNHIKTTERACVRQICNLSPGLTLTIHFIPVHDMTDTYYCCHTGEVTDRSEYKLYYNYYTTHVIDLVELRKIGLNLCQISSKSVL